MFTRLIFMNKAIFLDRDGTINVEKDYLYRIQDFEFLPGVIEALYNLQNNDYHLIIVTNQSGIARGYYLEDDFTRLNEWMKENLKKHGIFLDAVYYCPHHPNAKINKYRLECECRKPKLGMFQQAIKDLNIDIDQSFAIGDKIRDCAICCSTKCKGFLIGNNEKFEIVSSVKKGEYHNIQYADDLLDASRSILLQNGGI